jgi:hypothetical protein
MRGAALPQDLRTKAERKNTRTGRGRRIVMKRLLKIGLVLGLIMGWVYLCGRVTEEPDLSDRPRALTKGGWTATHTRLNFEKYWRAARVEDAVTLADMVDRGHLIGLPPNAEVYVLRQGGEWVKLKFVHRIAHPDVFAHRESIEPM